MKKIIIGVLVALFTPMMLQAGGVGIYVPYSLGIKEDATYSSDNYPYTDSDAEFDLKNKAGIGIALATNLSKDSVFGYKFALEYTHPQRENFTYSSDKIEMLHTFEFGIVRTKEARFWIGPRINVGYNWYENPTYSYESSGVEFGIAPAVGVNVNIGESFVIAFDIDYKFAWQGGSYEYYDGGYYSGTYSESVKGSTARLGLFFKFGESFE